MSSKDQTALLTKYAEEKALSKECAKEFNTLREYHTIEMNTQHQSLQQKTLTVCECYRCFT